jgi:hypothetical protein
VDGDDRGDIDIGDAEDLVGLVGLPPGRAQRRGEEVAAVPQQPARVQPQPPRYCLLSTTTTSPGPITKPARLDRVG